MEKTIKDLDIYISDGNYSSKYPRSEEFVEEGIPFIRGNNMVDGDITDDEMYYITPEKHGILLKGHVKAGDVLITTRGNIGQVAIVSERHEDSNINAQIVLLRTNPDSLYNRYLLWALQSKRANEQYLALQTGTALKQLPVGKLENLSIMVTDINEQHYIANILDKVYEVIKARRKELLLLDDLIKARFVELFGDAVDNPMGWEKKQLQEIVTDDCTISYGIVQTGDEQEEGVPVFRPVDIVNRVPKLEELKKTTKEISNKYKRTILKGREMLITVRANIADTCIIGEEFKGCNVGRGIVPIRTQEDIILLEFLKYLMDSKHLNDDIKGKAKGITLMQLNMEDLREVELIIPPIEQQRAFVEFAKQVDKSKVVVQKALSETQMLFDSLMQKYFG